MRGLLSGDWHLDVVTAGFDRYEDGRDRVRDLTNAAIEEGVDFFVFLGDLTDPDNVRSHRAVATAIGAYRLLKKNGVDSLWVVGNHDVINDGSELSTLVGLKAAGATVIEQPTLIEKAGHLIAVLPYPSKGLEYDPAGWVEDVDAYGAQPVLVVGHLSYPGVSTGSESAELARGRDVEWPVEAVRKRWPNAVLVGGHYHRRQEYGGVSFAGSLERLSFGEENNEPGYLLVEV